MSCDSLYITIISVFDQEIQSSDNMGVNETVRQHSLPFWAIYSKTLSPISMEVTLDERGQICLHVVV